MRAHEATIFTTMITVFTAGAALTSFKVKPDFTTETRYATILCGAMAARGYILFASNALFVFQEEVAFAEKTLVIFGEIVAMINGDLVTAI